MAATASSAGGQAAGGPSPNALTGPTGEIRGRLVEATSQAPITAGSITVRRAADTSFVGGALPEPDGSFRVNGIAPGRYVVRFKSIGFSPFTRDTVIVSAGQPVADLGTLSITAVPVQLESSVVTADKPDVALAPDRNSYSVKNMTTASGGTAVDVLRNVPSVEVDGSNNVSLRGNQNVVIQINGRATPLRGEQLGNFLAQLPASTVDHVEVATNPSAKNDPEGTAGIINIVLTQQAEMGLSGGLTAGTGTTGLANVSGNIGRQSGPLTLFTSYNFFRDTRAFSGHSQRANLIDGAPALVNGAFDGTGKPRSQNLTVRTEYKFSDRNALSADAVISGGKFARENGSFYANRDESGTITGLFNQFTDQSWRNLSQDYSLAFRRTGKPQQSTFSTEFRFTRNTSRFVNLLSSAIVLSDPSTGTSPTPAEFDEQPSRMPSFALQTDYSHPFGTGTKLESGFKGTMRTTSNDFTASFQDPNSGAFIPDAARANGFDYRERIGAVYAVLSQRVRKVDGQLGLRLEQANTRLDVPTTGNRYDNDYASLFPSAILTYNVTDMRQLKASYSRRITRPDPFQLNPIGFRDDARNAFKGNPALRPEYTDAFELGFQDTKPWGSIQLNPYLRRTDHAVRFIRTVDANGVSLGTFANVASTTAAGSDLNVTIKRGPLNLFGGGGAFRYSSDAGALSTTSFVWTARANVTWKLNDLTDAQMFANYRAPMKTEGGSMRAFVFSNFALRRKMWGDKGSVTLRGADPFNIMAFGFQTHDARVIETTERRFGVRGVFFTVSRNFGTQLKLRPRSQEPDQQQPPTGGP
jgi:outer membrane receptor protein involved in Fe transport